MKPSTRIDSAVFQLTPTRTRCDLVILANGRTEKIASGLLNPFLAHLKAARDQMAVGGYSIVLKPEPGSNATWFTKGTVESIGHHANVDGAFYLILLNIPAFSLSDRHKFYRFVRFVSTPEILERVDTLESEISQIEEAIAMQSNNNGGLPGQVEDHQGKSVENMEAARHVLDSNEDKAIVLYKPSSQSLEANGSTAQDGNSKVNLLKVLETRRNVLQKEQGMAFARAVAAGFEIDIMDTLLSFAECFGAIRMMDACKRFIELWKKKHESGQWLEIEAAHAGSAQSDFMGMNASGIVLTEPSNKQLSTSENNDEKSQMDAQVPVGQHEYFQGQYPNPMFPPWPIQSAPGVPPVYQPYPMAPTPYYPNYPANGPYFPPAFSPIQDQRSKTGRKSRHKSSRNGKESTSESEASEKDSEVNYPGEFDSEKEASIQRKKNGRPGKKKSGMVVIRNINYISSKKENMSDGEAHSASGSDKEDVEAKADKLAINGDLDNASHSNLLDKNDTYDNEIDGGHWKAFQNYLLKDNEQEDGANKGIFSMEKEARMKRHQKRTNDDPLAVGRGDTGRYEEGYTDLGGMSGSATFRRRASADAMLIPRKGDQQSDGRGSLDGHLDAQSNGINGRRTAYRRTDTDDFVVHGRDNIHSFSPSDLSAENRYKTASRGSNSRSSYNTNEDLYIVSLRSNSFNEAEGMGRRALDISSEFPSGSQNIDKASKQIQPNYEPDYMSLMPERETERGSSGFDPALDYEMLSQIHKDSAQNKSEEAMAAKNQGPKKEAKDQRMKLSRDADKRKTTGPIRNRKPAKLSPLDEARARAERMRSYKADLQKMKKEKEEEQSKRLEALKIERQKRIAARSSSVAAQSSSQFARKQLPSKLSPSLKESKFTDSEPSSSSPLQRPSMRTVSMESIGSHKLSRTMRLNTVKQSTGNRLSHSVASLPEDTKDSSSIKPDAKASMARIRRLSEPKMTGSGTLSSSKPQSTEARPKMASGTDSKKISAIMSLDKSKAATLPELKMRASKPSDASQTNLTAKKSVQTVSGNKLKNPKSNDVRITHQGNVDDNCIVEKTVVMLEPEKPSASHSSQEQDRLRKKHHDGDIIGEKPDSLLNNDNLQSPNAPAIVESDAIKVPEQISAIKVPEQISAIKVPEQTHNHEVRTYNLEASPRSMITQSSEKQYQAPYARISSLEDPCTAKSEYCKAPLACLDTRTEGPETVKVHLPDSHDLEMEKPVETIEKLSKESSSKGFKRLLKFGRKSNNSASSERITEQDNISVGESDADDHASHTAPSNEAYTLKNLISQDDTPTAVTTPKKSTRSFSLLSPFRSKNSEKKNT